MQTLWRAGITALLLALGGAAASVAAAASEPPSRFYSSLCVEAQSDDFAGFRLKLPSRGAGPASFEFGEGPLRRAGIQRLSFAPRTGRLRFLALGDAVDAAPERFDFSGRLVGRRLEGEMSTPWGSHRVRLIAVRPDAPPPSCSASPGAVP